MIEQAKGALMLVYGISSERAFGILTWRSQETNTKLHALAERFVEALAAEATLPRVVSRPVRPLAPDRTRAPPRHPAGSTELIVAGTPPTAPGAEPGVPPYAVVTSGGSGRSTPRTKSSQMSASARVSARMVRSNCRSAAVRDRSTSA